VHVVSSAFPYELDRLLDLVDDTLGVVVVVDLVPASNKGLDRGEADLAPEVDRLARAVAAVDDLIAGIRPEQWSAPTPCTEWTVRQLIAHLIGMNRVFIALLNDEPMPQPAAPPGEADLVGAFGDSAATLQAAFDRPGVLERT
jgi:hypothetical protein